MIETTPNKSFKCSEHLLNVAVLLLYPVTRM